ncbi:vancomycin resistance protein [Ureibacillus massiliensis 4400831 = CIP 108448 = CCUG 49529]|uniref:Vancomycin resistance protein n=1 Tax=Ureibacillus massiliensis 4400831 = CIP 108448 = CCUG 49529 TaxID=1211035 RepID=A0A0A3IRP3_9BACL|nr:YdcF family protein [Ureibacillus massiliensis]KGR87439.1 vancomycin resistance protein [Ureibacillus massiliensis 4400831 = CIP 108448 = CCUG 49529]
MKWWIGANVILVLVLGFGYFYLGTEIEKGKAPIADGSNDFLIILGAKVKPSGVPSLSLQYRLDVAIDYLKKYEHVQVIVSGGQGDDEPATEASVMAKYLIEGGIDPLRIQLEENSTSTYENLLFSKELLPEGVSEITIVSNDFHLARAKYLAKVVGLDADVIAAPTPNSVEIQSNLRERLALLKTYIVGK